MSTFDFEARQASAEWLTDELSSSGFLRNGKVQSLTQQPFSGGVHSAATLYRIIPNYASDAEGDLPVRILLKVTEPGMIPNFVSLAEEYSSFLLSPRDDRSYVVRKEAQFYERIRTSRADLPVPACYGSAVDEENLRCCLLLEEMGAQYSQPSELQSPSPKQSEGTIVAVAKLHAHWWNHELFGTAGFTEVTDTLIEETLTMYEKLYRQLIRALVSREQQRVLEMVLDRLPTLLGKRMVGSDKLTLVHGDLHQWNAFYLPNGEATILDWQTWHIDLPTHDLAYFMGVWWSATEGKGLEMPLLERYRVALTGHGVDYSAEELDYDYRLSVIRHLFTPIALVHFIPQELMARHMNRIFATFYDLGCEELLL
ncbi:MAG: aminoglycoside phosphotransferase family protein [Pseudomonadota bacterium]